MRTLGYLVAEWIADHLPSPGDPSRPFVLTDEQVGFLAEFYAVDARGRFLYRRGLNQQAKGQGKSPLAAALALAEFAGPVIYAGLDASKQPVGRPWTVPWVQIAASSESQADSNVYALVWEFLTVNDGKAAEELGIDLGRTRLYRKDAPASKLEAVTSEAGSREGQRTTFGVLDETHLWTRSSGGVKLARTLRRNVAKMDGRTLECSNAYELGASSIAEQTATAHAAGEPGILYAHNAPSVEPMQEMDDDVLLALLSEVYGDASWVDLPRILAEVRDPDTGWTEATRYFFNVASSGTDAFVDPERWADLVSDDVPAEGSRVALGFLGVAADSAALVMCDESHRIGVVDIWAVDVPRSEIDLAIRDAFEKFDVGAFFCDPRSWRTEAEAWGEAFGDRVIAYPANSPRRMAPALDRFQVAVDQGQISHDGDLDLTRHVTNARIRASRIGHTLEEESGRPITAAVAAVLALEARAHMVEAPPPLVPMIAWV